MKRSVRYVAVALALAVAVGASMACAGRRVRATTPSDQLAFSLTSPKAYERKRAAEMLGRRRDPRGTYPLINALTTERNERVIVAILYALAYIGAPEAEAVLQGHLSHPSHRVAYAAQRALVIYAQYRPYYGRPLVQPYAGAPAQAVPPPPPETQGGEVEYE